MSVPERLQSYQPFGDLRLKFPGHGEAQEYRRELDLNRATVKVSYRIEDAGVYARGVRVVSRPGDCGSADVGTYGEVQFRRRDDQPASECGDARGGQRFATDERPACAAGRGPKRETASGRVKDSSLRRASGSSPKAGRSRRKRTISKYGVRRPSRCCWRRPRAHKSYADMSGDSGGLDAGVSG